MSSLDMTSSKCNATLHGHTFSVNCVTISSDGKMIASGGNDSTVKVWDMDSGSSYVTRQNHGQYVISVAFSPDGRWIVSGSVGRSQHGSCLATLQDHSESVTCVSISPNGQKIVSGSDDFAVKVWDMASSMRAKSLCRVTASLYSRSLLQF